MSRAIDYLTEDEPIPGQLWVCLSFLSPEGIRNCNIRGLKIRGVYATREEADKRAAALQEIDLDFHVFVGEMGKWLPWDPDPNDVADQVYKEQAMQDLMKGYKENLAKAKEAQQQHKERQKTTAAANEKTRSTRDRLRAKLEAKKQQKRMGDLATRQTTEPSALTEQEQETLEREAILKTKEDVAKQERERLSANQEAVNKKEQDVENIDARMRRIKDLYDRANKK